MAKFLVNVNSLLLHNRDNLVKLLINSRHIMTTQQLCEETLDDLQKNNTHYQKYADKIAKLQQTSPEEFLSRVSELEKSKEKKTKKQLDNPPMIDNKYSQLLKPKKAIGKIDGKNDKEYLEKIMKLDLIQDKTREEIKEIWHKYHLEKNYISAVLTKNEYDLLYENGRKYPIFLLPLPRQQGYEFMMLQFERNSVHFTPLLYYQVHKENAPECLTLTHYVEMKDTKDVVLMRGEYDMNIINLKEALCLANQLKMYYVTKNEEKLKLLKVFNQRPTEFKHMDLIKQIETLTL